MLQHFHPHLIFKGKNICKLKRLIYLILSISCRQFSCKLRRLFWIIFIMAWLVIFLDNIIDLMAMFIWAYVLMARCFALLWWFLRFSLFLECPPRILDDFTWGLPKESPTSNIKIRSYPFLNTKSWISKIRIRHW